MNISAKLDKLHYQAKVKKAAGFIPSGFMKIIMSGEL